jgi:hypothetical protein
MRYEGMVSEAKISFFDIGDVNSSIPGGPGLITPSNLNSGLFSIMYQSGARIFTNSWGTSANNYDSLAVFVDEFMWENKDALVLFSAGNTGESVGAHSVGSPSTNKNGVCVGASLNDHQSWLAYEASGSSMYGVEAVAGFSSIGPTTDNRLKPDVLAPGYWVTSALGEYNSSEAFCGVKAIRGTSMACPTAAGFALKIRQYLMDGFYPGGARGSSAGFTPSGALLKAMLVHSSRPMLYSVHSESSAISDISSTYPSAIQGYGRIEMSSVLNFGEDASVSPINLFLMGSSDSSQDHYTEFYSSGVTHYYNFNSDGSPIRVTLQWTDYPGSALTSETNGEALVNFLLLRVTSNVGDNEYSYLVSGMVRDNTQVVDIPSPTNGATFTAQVYCSVLSNNGPQPYALVITGGLQYLTGSALGEDQASVSSPSDSFTVTGGALKYVLILGLLGLFLMLGVFYFYRISKRKPSLLVDPNAYGENEGYDEAAYENGLNGKKGIFAKIRSIRSNHLKTAERRQMEKEAAQFSD